jgi:imidazolonepropionase-like amidohydrolase
MARAQGMLFAGSATLFADRGVHGADGAATAFQQDAVTVLRFREVWDGERAIPHASVLIRGQRIAAVGRTSPSGRRAGRRFSAADRVPGLIDLHTHVTYVWDRAPGTTPLRPGRRPHAEETAEAAASTRS